MKVSYEQDGKIAYFNGHRFTRDDRTNYYLASHLIDGKRKRLHIYVWEYFNGPVPSGCQIHHVDEDKRHNDIDNLECLTLHDHMSLHSREYHATEKAKEHFDRVRDAAKEWHKSEAGREWHKDHFEKIKDRLFIPHEYTCEYCGKKFVSTKAGSKYCCKNHRAYARRQHGADNIECECAVCGKPFIKNKYEKTRTCGRKCGSELRKITLTAKVI